MVRVLSGVLYSIKIDRGKFLLKFRSKYHTLKSESCEVTKKYPTVSKPVKSCRDRTKNWTLRWRKKHQQILSFFLKTLSRRLGLLDSILVVQSRMRTLYLYWTPSGCNASVSSRYSDLWGRFLTSFHPQSA